MKTSDAKHQAASRFHPAAVIGAVILTAAIIMVSSRKSSEVASQSRDASTTHDNPPSLPSSKSSLPSNEEAVAISATAAKELTAKIRGFAAQFKALPTKYGSADSPTRRAAAQQLLLALRQALRSAPSDVATAAITSYLNSHEDAITGLDFSVGEGGVLTEAASVRTALLDMLAQVEPSASVTYAKQVLAESKSSDEWALAMRNLGWQNQDGTHTEALRQSLGKMLDNQQWLEQPTPGFYEAFDVAVHLGGVPELQNMASVLRLEDANGKPVQNGVSRAANLALDRMTIRNPGQTVQQLDADPEFLSWAPENRANLMARATVADADQRAAVERYLQRSDLKPGELKIFLDLFPNRNGSLGYTLVTTPGNELDFQQNYDNDRAALAAVSAWQQDPRFQARQAELQQLSARLTAFVKAAADSKQTTTPATASPSGTAQTAGASSPLPAQPVSK